MKLRELCLRSRRLAKTEGVTLRTHSADDGERVAETASDWSAPEINFPLTAKSVSAWKSYLMNGTREVLRSVLAANSRSQRTWPAALPHREWVTISCRGHAAEAQVR